MRKNNFHLGKLILGTVLTFAGCNSLPSNRIQPPPTPQAQPTPRPEINDLGNNKEIRQGRYTGQFECESYRGEVENSLTVDIVDIIYWNNKPCILGEKTDDSIGNIKGYIKPINIKKGQNLEDNVIDLKLELMYENLNNGAVQKSEVYIEISQKKDNNSTLNIHYKREGKTISEEGEISENETFCQGTLFRE